MTSRRERAAWHAGAAAAFALAAVLTMRPWLDPSVTPGNDFPGFAAEVEWTRAVLDRDGRLPTWMPDRFAGTTRFMSNLKEIATYPLATLYGAVQGTKLMFLLMRIVGAFGVYLICARHLGAPGAGLVAGYAYGFGAPANLQSTLGGHLDLAISSALFPLILLAAAAMLEHRRTRDAVVVGALVAVEFCVHSYLQAMVVPVLVLLLLWRRPWGGEPRRGDVGLVAVALVVFLVLTASQTAWLAADLRHHGLHSAQALEQGLVAYVEHSPFSYVNRNDWLGGWLAAHAPPGMVVSDYDHFFNQRRYLGIVALVINVAGWCIVRADPVLRRWFQVFLLLFVFQWWMALGPHTFLAQLGRTFHWPENVDWPLRALLSAGAGVCLGWGVGLLREGAPRPRAELAFGLALAQMVAAHSMFAVLSVLVPIFRGMRSPGHFFDLASFPFFALLGVSVAAAVRHAPRAARVPLVLAVAAALVLDYLPTLAAFERRRDGDALERMRRAVAALPGEEGTLRIAVSPAQNAPATTLVTADARAGSAWTWLSWQAGRHWEPYLTIAMTPFVTTTDDPGALEVARRTSAALMRSGRLRWVLEDFITTPRLRVEPPWRHVAEAGTLALWEGPEVLPMGTVFRAYALFVGGTEWQQAPAVAAAFGRGILAVAGGEQLAESTGETVEGAAIVRALGTESVDVAARGRLGAKLLDAGDPTAGARWATFLQTSTIDAPVAAAYTRTAPERMELEVDAGSSPAIVFLSEAHHPWWRARVDGAAAEVLRAQLAFMAVRVPPGPHRVELELRPPRWVRVADRVTQLAWIGIAGAVLVAAARTMRRMAA